ncbi:MAG TPA: hypothetical protein PLL98_01875 [Bacillota bacterium]|nr:hypothetical protein [Bacillota bacterium]HOR85212.1 hypothetical protein [Bacillota bacterium]HPL53405.1 hypothetical protein [Bacillota bacterium]
MELPLAVWNPVAAEEPGQWLELLDFCKILPKHLPVYFQEFSRG